MNDDGCNILHVDMDAFFASVEIRDNPALRGLPVVVGRDGPRSVVAAASYPARAYGVYSAMAMAIAKSRCPKLVAIPPRMAHYRAISAQVMAILESFTPVIQQVSVDEAFLDVSGALRHFGSPGKIASQIRARVRQEVGLPCSVGVAAAKSIAKIASGKAKPDGLLVVPAAESAAFLAPLPVGAVWGVGRVASGKLSNMGIHTVGDLAAVPLPTLRRIVGVQAVPMQRVAQGLDDAPVGTQRVDKSMGMERTYDEDLVGYREIHAQLVDMADTVAARLRSHGTAARTVSIKVRLGDGQTLTRSVTMTQPSASGERIREHVLALWQRLGLAGQRVRLLGVRGENLGPATSVELSSREGWDELEAAMDKARQRFGEATLRRGSTLL
ncbi:DNA polymerase IV [Dermabacteraceae bacterium P7054]